MHDAIHSFVVLDETIYLRIETVFPGELRVDGPSAEQEAEAELGRERPGLELV